MPTTLRGTMRVLAALLLVTVVTQIFYITIVSNAPDDTPLRPTTWLIELSVFVGISTAGLSLAINNPQRAPLWSLIVFSGLANVMQIAMGLSMFGPSLEVEKTVPAIFATVIAGAFFFYFLAKLLLGVVAVAFGWSSVRTSKGLPRIIGGLAALAGVAAAMLSVLAMLDRMAWIFPAGTAGTVVAALFAINLLTAREG